MVAEKSKALEGLNRTFMELKQNKKAKFKKAKKVLIDLYGIETSSTDTVQLRSAVLIEPLWN